MMETRGSQRVGSVEKALDILLAFEPGQPELGVSEIARRLQLGVSTVHRLLATLVHKGFVQQNPATAKYALGIEVVRLVAVVLASSDVRAASQPHMERLRDLTGETVRLHALVSGRRVCLDQVESREVIRVTGGIGKTYPLYSGAASKAILAHLPAAEREAVLRQAAGDGLDPMRLGAELAQVRERGYAVSIGENAAGAASLAAPILNGSGRPVAALTVSGPSNRWTTREMLASAPAVVEAAGRISSRLGFVAPREHLLLAG